MSRNKEDVIQRIKNNMSLEGFEKLVPPEIEAKSIYNRTLEKFTEEEATEVLAEIILTVTATCDRDDFHSWNYDHLEYIIELERVRVFHPQESAQWTPRAADHPRGFR